MIKYSINPSAKKLTSAHEKCQHAGDCCFYQLDTHTGMWQNRPGQQWQAQTFVTKKSISSSDLVSNLMVADKSK